MNTAHPFNRGNGQRLLHRAIMGVDLAESRAKHDVILAIARNDPVGLCSDLASLQVV